MATMITNDCINCGACEPECPNNAISQGETDLCHRSNAMHGMRWFSRLRGMRRGLSGGLLRN